MEKLKELVEIKHQLVDASKMYLAAGVDNVDTKELGEVVDMIKDLAEAEKACIETCYYETIIEAMGGEERSGYDRWRYASGRFAPKGRGHMTSGYTPSHDIYMHNMIPDFMMDGGMNRMGYPSGGSGSRGGSSSGRGSSSSNGGQGRSGYSYPMESAYDRYMDARRHYHESKDDNDKMLMNHHAQEHVEEAVDSIKEMWETSDPDTKRKMKGTLSKLVAEMAV